MAGVGNGEVGGGRGSQLVLEFERECVMRAFKILFFLGVGGLKCGERGERKEGKMGGAVWLNSCSDV